MNTKCNTCGAPQQLNDSNTCIYCGDVLKNEDLSEDLLKDFIPIKYEYSQENYAKVIVLADDYLKKDLYNIPCWAYKISAEFLFNSEKLKLYDYKNLKKSLQSLIDLKITNSISQKVIENQIDSIFEIIACRDSTYPNNNFNDLKDYITNNLSSELITSITEKYNSIPIVFDPLFEDAVKLIVSAQQGSTSLLQTRMKLGYNRAESIMQRLTELGIIGPMLKGQIQEVIIKTDVDLYYFLEHLRKNPKDNYQNYLTKKTEDTKVVDLGHSNLNKSKIQDEPKKGCFIATATMGDYNHPIVLDLRLFRDSWLLKRTWGVNFTNWYYKNSPIAAKFIEQNELLRNLTFYILIKPLHFISKKLK